MKSKIISIAVFATLFSINVMADTHTHWSYSGEDAPENWGKLSPEFALCEVGKNQSPIDITIAYKTEEHPLVISYTQDEQSVINNGHTVQVDLKSYNSYLELDGEKFFLQQFHFHTPSENLISGKSFPLEAHLVHTNSDDDITVLAIMFEEGAENTELLKVWQHFPEQVDSAEDIDQPIDLNALLPVGLHFFRFSGSLTTPPCTEGVRWLVLKDSVTVSAEQVEQFAEIVHSHNNRPVQPLNGRPIISE